MCVPTSIRLPQFNLSSNVCILVNKTKIRTAVIDMIKQRIFIINLTAYIFAYENYSV